mgnify:CR=1 FL=1
MFMFFFFSGRERIRDLGVAGVQTVAPPVLGSQINYPIKRSPLGKKNWAQTQNPPFRPKPKKEGGLRSCKSHTGSCGTGYVASGTVAYSIQARASAFSFDTVTIAI